MSARNTFAATRRSHEILGWLRSGQRVTITDVSDRFGVQYPQAREDLKLLEEVYELDTGREGRIKYWEWPGISSKEAVVGTAAALELGGVALDIFRETPYGEFIDALAHDQRNSLAQTQQEGLRRVGQALRLRRNWLPVERKRLVEMLETVLDAIHQGGKGLSFEYERSSDGDSKRYLAVPRRLIWYQGRLWMQAYQDKKRKLFDVAGILDVEELFFDRFVDRLIDERRDELAAFEYEGDRSKLYISEGGSGEVGDDGESIIDPVAEKAYAKEREEAFKAVLREEVEREAALGSPEEEDAYFENAFGIYAYSGPADQVELEVGTSWATYLRRYRVHASQENEDLEDGRLKVRFELAICPEFTSFVLGMLPEVKVLKPASLQATMEEAARSWLEG
ncbi:WYL domain-containing protein [Lujinxingia vulgaris]|uniref:WYL domain-containing protein n=1 Tax=Lujinxingia vulgaris TaxID=2600176 RepID=A0A5C6X9I1_9DELT|nr:WYL domain-containing protein [Lujinxingia vulgaris]TXD33930.1 WYL domain-containing protein [Lujinxingia vulgaris]